MVVVDADHRVRESLAELLGLGDELQVVGRASSAAAALDLCASLHPDVVVIDPRLPDVDGGVELLRSVRVRCPDTTVLVLSWPGSAAEREAAGLGADGILPKSAAPHEFVDQILSLVRVAAERRPV